MGKLYQALFGVRVTIIYNNGVKIQARLRKLTLDFERTRRSIEWRQPIFGGNDALLMNVDEIYAIWQGHV